jgi:hypothetical protein
MSVFDFENGSGGRDGARAHVAAEMVRSAVAEFLGMERSLRAAAKHLAAAAEGTDSDAGGVAGDMPDLAAMVARVTLVA